MLIISQKGEAILSAKSDFLNEYNNKLNQNVLSSDMPAALTEEFTFDCCVKKHDDREVYFITRQADGQQAVLRITAVDSGENAGSESAILAKLSHPAIPKVLAEWEHNGRHFIVREYFDGEDLHAYVRRHGVLNRELLTAITVQLCDILSYIHGQSPAVIHRDITPENIILSGRNQVKLIDFGIARRYRPEAESDTEIAGKRLYMAPEQFGSAQTDHRADLYSLGMVMVYMALGSPDHRNLPAAYPYKELTAVIRRCLRKDREQRFATAAHLKRKILWKQHRMTRKILVSAINLLVIAAAAAAGFYVGQGYGYQEGITAILSTPTVKNRMPTYEEQIETLVFKEWMIETAVRSILNKDMESPIYRGEVMSYVGTLQIFGTSIVTPDVSLDPIKKHLGEGAVAYWTGQGLRVFPRGDIVSLEDLPHAYYLRDLTLTSQSIADLTPLAGMKLEKIVLCDNFIGNLLPLKDMATLRMLDLCQNPLQDLTPISELFALEYLDISHTQVTDLKPLAKLTKLEALNLNYCNITDISVLAQLPNLTEVDLSNTLVTDLKPLVRPEHPVTVRCFGMDDEVLEQVRGMEGIVLIEE